MVSHYLEVVGTYQVLHQFKLMLNAVSEGTSAFFLSMMPT